MDYLTLAYATTALGTLTLMLASLLVLANRRFYVYEDPRLDTIEEMLPKANCGGCGYPSCRAFAEALIAGQVLPGGCGVSSDGQRAAIAAYLNVAEGHTTRQVARLACAGGRNVARNRAQYLGPASCAAATAVGGGGKACAWGCLGFGDCAEACTFGAITMDTQGLPVIDETLCTACGDCVAICPKSLLHLQPVTHHLWVRCQNHEQGEQVLAECQVGCTACGRCALDAGDRHVSVRDNLAVVDYRKSLGGREAIERCPTGAIVWLEHGGVVTGHEAPPVVRQSPLPYSAT